MKNLMITVAASALLTTPAFAQAGPASTANATASVKIVIPLSIACTELKYGKLAPLQNGVSTVTIDAQGDIEDPQNIVVPGTKVEAQPSNCSVNGEHMLGYKVSLPASATISNGSTTMTLNNFTISSDDPLPADSRVLETATASGGIDGFGVGATLNVGAAQQPGVYTGSFQVSVQYN